MHNNKACGDSFITSELLKAIGKISVNLPECISHMFNYFATKGVPNDWNQLSLRSLFKKGDKNDCNNYRGLSIMGTMPKLFSCILNNLLTDFCV